MAARESMAELIAQVRVMIGDPAGTSQVFTDEQIQYAMDTHRWEVRYMTLRGLASYESGSAVYKIWQAPFGNWEDDAELVNGQYKELTAATADYLNGRWTFTASQTTVLISGQSYDLFAASADLLESWAAKVALEFDFTADGGSFHRSQKGTALRGLAAEYRKKQQIKVVHQERGDIRAERF